MPRIEEVVGRRARSLLRSPGFSLLVVAIVYLLVQLILFDEGRYLAWDEAVYVGESSQRFLAPGWSPHRASGILWVVKPAFLVSDSFTVLRLYLAVASAGILGLAFSRWLRPGNWLAPLGMAVFAFGWLPLFYGTEVSPNLYVAATAVGAVGSMSAYTQDGRRRDLIWLTLFIAAAVFLRPTDGLVLAAGVGLASIAIFRSVRVFRVFTALAIGLGVGMLPWMLEAFGRFGGPIERLRNASDLVGGGPTWNVPQYVYLLNGHIGGSGDLWSSGRVLLPLALVYALLISFGMANRRKRPLPQLALGMTLLLALPYLVYVGAYSPRFLMPSIAVASIAVAAGVLFLWERSTILGAVAVLALLAATLWSMSVADRVESEQFHLREDAHEVAVVISDQAGGGQCEFLSQYGYPQMMVASNCHGRRAVLEKLGCQLKAIQEQNRTASIFVTLVSPPPDDIEMYLTPVDVDNPIGRWTIFTVTGDELVRCDTD